MVVTLSDLAANRAKNSRRAAAKRPNAEKQQGKTSLETGKGKTSWH